MIGLLTESPFVFFILITVFLMSLALHEFAHAASARYLGDDTAYLKGRYTINPFSHLDPMGALMFLFAGFGWANPVPVDPSRFKKVTSLTGMGIVSLAGPMMNVLIAFLVWLPFRIIGDVGGKNYSEVFLLIREIAEFTAVINISLAAFNLIPIPPLDGSKVLQSLTLTRFYEFWWEFEKKGGMILLILIGLSIFTNGVFNPIGWFMDIVGIPFRLFVFSKF